MKQNKLFLLFVLLFIALSCSTFTEQSNYSSLIARTPSGLSPDDLIQQEYRPSIKEILSVIDDINVDPSQISAKFQTYIEKEFPELLSYIDGTFPNSKLAFIGRDSAAIADIFEAYYLHMGIEDKILRINMSGNSFPKDQKLLLDYLDSLGISSSANAQAPVIFIDTISTPSGGRQPRKLLHALYESYKAQGGDSTQFFKRFNIIGLSVQAASSSATPVNTQAGKELIAKQSQLLLANPNLYSALEGKIHVWPNRSIGGYAMNEIGYESKLFWHDSFGSLQYQTDGSIRALAGSQYPANKKGVLAFQKYIFEEIGRPDVLEAVQDVAAARNVQLSHLRIDPFDYKFTQLNRPAASITLTGTKISNIQFSEEELKYLSTILEGNTNPDPTAIKELMQDMPPELNAKLRAVNQGSFNIANNSAMEQLSRATGYSPRELLKVREAFDFYTAEEVLHQLANDPHMQIRLLSRDCDSIYNKAMSLLESGNALNFSAEEKLQIAKRLKLVNISRAIADKVSDSNIRGIMRVSEKEIREASKIIILDVGYQGTIPKSLNQKIQTAFNSKAEWSLLWRADSAPSYITEWNGENFQKYVKTNFPKIGDKCTQATCNNTGFRVGAIEHQAKWHNRMTGLNSDPVVIMLDLDDTVLKEVDVSLYRDHQAVSFIEYTPDANSYAKYEARLNAGPAAGKVIHYELDNGIMRGYVTIRPGMEDFFQELEPLIKEGRVKLLVTSANDPARTQAIFEQLKIGENTLEEWGAEYISRDKFMVGAQKDINKLKSNLGISHSAPIAIADDLPGNVINRGANDIVLNIEPWDLEFSSKYLNDPSSISEKLMDDFARTRLNGNKVYQMTFKTEMAPLNDRLIIMAKQVAHLDKKINTNHTAKLSSSIYPTTGTKVSSAAHASAVASTGAPQATTSSTNSIHSSSSGQIHVTTQKISGTTSAMERFRMEELVNLKDKIDPDIFKNHPQYQKAKSIIDNFIKEEFPALIGQIEAAHPGAKMVFVGQESFLMADIFDAFYTSQGVLNKVVRLHVSQDVITQMGSQRTAIYLEKLGLKDQAAVFISSNFNSSASGHANSALYFNALSNHQMSNRSNELATLTINVHPPGSGLGSNAFRDHSPLPNKWIRGGSPNLWNADRVSYKLPSKDLVKLSDDMQLHWYEGNALDMGTKNMHKVILPDSQKELLLSMQKYILQETATAEVAAKVESSFREMGQDMNFHFNKFNGQLRFITQYSKSANTAALQATLDLKKQLLQQLNSMGSGMNVQVNMKPTFFTLEEMNKYRAPMDTSCSSFLKKAFNF